MIKVRQGVFETNGSSTHSICIAQTTDYIIPDKVSFGVGEFGWEVDKLSSLSEKASYLYTAIHTHSAYADSFMDQLKQYMEELGFSENEGTAEYGEIRRNEWGGFNGYIDHGYDTYDFVSYVLSSPDNLAAFLFSPLSFILTGNDNCDISVDVDVDYPHIVFEKGN